MWFHDGPGSQTVELVGVQPREDVESKMWSDSSYVLIGDDVGVIEGKGMAPRWPRSPNNRALKISRQAFEARCYAFRRFVF